MRILFVLEQPYPYGMACTKRIHLYAKVLKELGNEVKIIIPKPTEKYDNVRNIMSKGMYEGISFNYSSYSTFRSKYFFNRRIQEISAFLKLFTYSVGFRPDIIISISESFLKIFAHKILSFITHSIYIGEKSEVPFWKKNKLSYMDILNLRLIYSLYDGIIVISENLKNYYRNVLHIKCKMIKIPIICKIDNHISENNEDGYINFVYTGSFVDRKDGIILLIKAFAKLKKKYSNISLTLVGDLDNSPDKNKIMKNIKNCNISDRVILKGYVTEVELCNIRKNATVLLSVKPYNRQNIYNMATKVGEYLQTGKPVILSSIDPAAKYLKHKTSALIIKPESDEIANLMEYIIMNPTQSREIGERGKEIASKYFNYKYQVRRLNQFLKLSIIRTSIEKKIN